MKFLKASGLLVMVALLLSLVVVPVSATPGEDHKVDICHRTRSDTNPYVFISVDVASLSPGHLDNADPGHKPRTWKTDGVWRGVAHVAGDEKDDYLAPNGASDCQNASSSPSASPSGSGSASPSASPSFPTPTLFTVPAISTECGGFINVANFEVALVDDILITPGDIVIDEDGRYPIAPGEYTAVGRVAGEIVAGPVTFSIAVCPTASPSTTPPSESPSPPPSESMPPSSSPPATGSTSSSFPPVPDTALTADQTINFVTIGFASLFIVSMLIIGMVNVAYARKRRS